MICFDLFPLGEISIAGAGGNDGSQSGKKVTANKNLLVATCVMKVSSSASKVARVLGQIVELGRGQGVATISQQAAVAGLLSLVADLSHTSTLFLNS